MNPVFWALVRKDIYLMRGFILAILGVGILSMVLVMTGRIGFAIGGVLFLTANVAGAIFISMYSVLTERKDQSRLFALSLPISGRDYGRAKLVGVCVAYGIPWAVLTAMALGLILLSPRANQGTVVYIIVLQGFVLALFSVVLAALFTVTSELMSGLLIMIVNVLFSLFMVTINQPSIAGQLRGPVPVWSPFALWSMAGEITVLALSVCFVLIVTARRRDHI